MNRFYPTVTTLPIVSGKARVLVTDGNINDCVAAKPDSPAIWTFDADPNNWDDQPLLGAKYNTTTYSFDLSTYPLMLMLPTGKVVQAGGHNEVCNPGQSSYYGSRQLDLALETWANFPGNPSGIIGASAVMVNDRIIKAGGPNNQGAPIAGVEGINLSSDSSSWSQLSSMSYARDDMYLVGTPDGKVIAVGGAAQTPAEQYNIGNDIWTTLAVMEEPRLYHTSAVLLPNGSIFVAGGNQDDPNSEDWYRTYTIFKPPYMFWSNRPAVDPNWVPHVMHYGTAYDIPTANANDVTKVRLIRLGAATHAFDQGQRVVDLTFALRNSTTIRAVGPNNEYVAPAGYYLLFIATGTNGNFPSEGRFIRLLP